MGLGIKLSHLVFLAFVLCISARNLQSNITDLIKSYGYHVDVHQAQTQDGYVLTLHRIPRGFNNSVATKGAVLLQHGLTDASAGWALNPPSLGLAYILADAGYDVWLGNNRGNGYSMTNIHFPSSDPRFWDFCWDDMATSDFPTSINYVLQATSSAKISYIGHSEGTIQAFAGLISNPSLADKLHVYIGLAPVAYVGKLTVGIIRLLADLEADNIFKLLGVNELSVGDLVHVLLPAVCKINPAACNYGGSFIYGSDSYLNASMLDLYTNYEPFPTSVKNIVHWAQSVRGNVFSKFDYGKTGNMQHYNQPTPPAYDLSKFPTNLPTVLFTGGIDGLADPQDVQRLMSEISVKPKVYYRSDYGHLDPLLGDQAFKLTYPSILAELASHANRR